MLTLPNILSRHGQYADRALMFMRQLRPAAPWTFVAQGRGWPQVASFLPTIAEQAAAARSWIIGRQRKGLDITALIGNTSQPPQRPFTTEEITGTSVIALSITGKPAELEARINALPTEPTALIHTGMGLAALYVLKHPLAIGAATQLSDELARRCSGAPAWLIPLPGLMRPNGKQARIIRYIQSRTFDKAELSTQTKRRRVMRASDVTPANIDWLWRHMIPKGALTIVAGFGSAGKTTMCLSLAAAISQGSAWPDGTPAPSGRAMIIEGEDDVDTVTVPRLIAAGADLDRIILADPGEDILTPQDLEDASAGATDLRLVVLSPIRRLIQDTQTTNTEIRRRLEPLIEWARDRRVGLIGIMHPQKGNKSQSADALAGSAAYTELARSVHLGTIDENDPEPVELLKRRKLVSIKTNIAPAGIVFDYRIETTYAGEIETSRVVWLTPGATEPSEPKRPRTSPVQPPSPQLPPVEPIYKTACEAWLARKLANGPRMAADIEQAAIDAGFSRATLYRAALAIRVRRRATGGGKVEWHLGNGGG